MLPRGARKTLSALRKEPRGARKALSVRGSRLIPATVYGLAALHALSPRFNRKTAFKLQGNDQKKLW